MTRKEQRLRKEREQVRLQKRAAFTEYRALYKRELQLNHEIRELKKA